MDRIHASVFLLKAGQALHIPKGCLHAFRKLSAAPLPQYDCHAKLCKKYLETRPTDKEEVCISFAWDWIRLGNSGHSVAKELDYLTMASRFSTKEKIGPPAPYGLSLLRTAKKLVSEPEKLDQSVSARDLAEGILPSLSAFVDREVKAVREARSFQMVNKNIEVVDTAQSGGPQTCDSCKLELYNFF